MRIGLCSIVSISRLYQAIALFKSLIQFSKEYSFYFLYMDQATYNILKKLDYPGLNLVELQAVEDERLCQVKRDRNESEYCWTLKPAMLLYVLQRFENLDAVCYLDADLYFFNAPHLVFELLKKSSVLVTTHKVNRSCNGGFACFKNNIVGKTCVQWWREKCISWCYAKRLGALYGDQGYLDELAVKFKDVKTIENPGVNTAVWNYFKFDLSRRRGIFYVNTFKLVFFHFSGFKPSKLGDFLEKNRGREICKVYLEYDRALKACIKEINSVYPEYEVKYTCS